MGRRKQPLYSEDASRISGLEEALIKGNAAKRTVKNTVGFLRSFGAGSSQIKKGRWLFGSTRSR